MLRIRRLLILIALILPISCSPRVEVPAEDGMESDTPDARIPTIRVTPDHAEPGETVQITASGFPSGEEVVIGFGPPESEYEVLTRVTAGPMGQVSAAADVPSWAERARAYVWVVAAPDNEPRAISGHFHVGDEPQSGEESVRITGVVTDEGVECTALRADDGALYTLTGEPEWVQPGDRIVVTGRLVEVSTCMQGTTISVTDAVEE